MPDPSSKDFNKMRGGIERQGKNHPIQGTNACTIKQSMNYIVERIKPYDAKLLLTVHDEVIVEARSDQAQEVSAVVSQSMIDGFAEFVPEVKMKADADVENYWVKG
jgi:DNA polymerase I-like protein with 3'-5' exonuclease and polymerase domains